MASSQDCRLRHLAPAEMGILIDWMDREGWNPGLNDAQAFAAADPQGFFVAERAGEPVALGSAVRYGEHFAFCGCYIVDPRYRGQGFGWALTRARLEHVGDRITGIDGVVDMQAQYRNIGYEIAYRNVRYGGVAPRKRDPHPEFTLLSDIPLSEWADFDAKVFPAGRDVFLDAWRNTPGHLGLVALAGSRITGYAVRRPCRTGWKIGPLFADQPETAEALLDALLAGIPGEAFVIDVPEVNAQAVALVQSRNLNPVFETARMYRNGRPVEDVNRVFGVTTFELG